MTTKWLVMYISKEISFVITMQCYWVSFTYGTYTEESWWCIFQSKSFFSFWVYQVYYWSFLRVTAIFYAWYRSLGVSLVQGRLILTARKSKWTQWMAAWKLIVKRQSFNNNTKYQKVYFFLKILMIFDYTCCAKWT